MDPQTNPSGFDAGALAPAPENLGRKVATDEVRREPGKMYEGRRRILLILTGVFVLAFFCMICKLGSNPFAGADMALGAGAVHAAGESTKTVTASGLFGASVSATAVPAGGLLNSLQPAGGNSSIQSVTSAAAGRAAMPSAPVSYYCRAVSNFQAGGYDIPKASLVQVDGFSYAGGGEVHLVEPAVGWVTMIYLTCPPEIVGLERPFFVVATGTPRAASPAAAPVRVVTVQVPVMQVATAAPVNGVVLGSDGCLVFSVVGVRSIYADGAAVAGGERICGVSSFTVNVK